MPAPTVSHAFTLGAIIENESGVVFVFKGSDLMSSAVRQHVVIVDPAEIDIGDWTVGDPVTLTVTGTE